jgi:hypothetical protein
MTKESELAALERNLANALQQFKLAEGSESYARRERCDAQNTLNAAQKQLDAYLKKLRDAAPRESDWGQERTKKFAVKDAA